MFANTMMSAMNMGFPDVCLTPLGPDIAPIPYPNISTTLMGIPTVPNILIDGMPAQNMLSMVTFSQGDDTGVLGGVASGMEMGPTIPLLGAETVLANGIPMTRLTSTNIQNMTNCPGATITPSQVTMLLLVP